MVSPESVERANKTYVTVYLSKAVSFNLYFQALKSTSMFSELLQSTISKYSCGLLTYCMCNIKNLYSTNSFKYINDINICLLVLLKYGFLP